MDKKILEYQEVELSYQKGAPHTLCGISFSINEGEFVTILGSSGSGKTTLIKLANRLLEPTSGAVLFDGQNVKDLDRLELRKKIGYVIQQVGLFPHMTVEENIEIMPKVMGWDSKKRKERVDQLLEVSQLPVTDEFKKRHPWQLSGGQQQRVGLARALCSEPKVLLMDEPFGALDVVTRKELQRELLNIHKKFRKTILFVTHDLQEAISLGDRVLVIHEGKIQQFDTPKNMVLYPANDYIRELFDATTPTERMMYFKVKDFGDLLRMDERPQGVEMDWEDSMEKVLNGILQGYNEILIFRGQKYMGYFLRDDLKKIGEVVC